MASRLGSRAVLEVEIRQALAELELVSHAPTQNLEATGRSSEDPGGREPPGGDVEKGRMSLDERMALRDSYHGKTVAHYRALWASVGPSEALRDDIRATVRAWRVMRVPEGQPPALGDPLWKRWVAESELGVGELARLFNVPRQYIYRVRKEWRLEAE